MIYLYVLLYLIGMVLFTRFAKRRWRWYSREGPEGIYTIVYPIPLLVVGLMLVIHYMVLILGSPFFVSLYKIIANPFIFIWSITFGWALKEPEKDKK